MRRLLPLALSVMFANQLHAAPLQHLEIEVDGQPVRLTLTPRDATENSAFAHGEHFRGHIEGEPDSWVRLSRINGQWQGLIHSRSGIHVLETEAAGNRKARALSEIDAPMQCGNDVHTESEASGLRSAMRATQGNFDTLCEDAVDGVCAGIEVEMVFDQEFVSTFPGNYEAQGASLLNMVEGFYLESFGIRFNTLGMTYLDKQVFLDESTSTDFLGDIREKKLNGELEFVKNPSAIMHVVRGKPFTDATTAGIAWVKGLCNASGYSSGSSVLYRQSAGGSPSLSLTALVTTHEIGHNLGALHDNSAEVACPSGFIMDAMVNPYANDFSTCSKTAIKGYLGDVSGWAQCTNYPIRMNVNADAENPLALPAVQPVTHRFTVNYVEGYARPRSAAVTLELEGAVASAATIDGGSCQRSEDQQQVTCVLSATGTPTLTLTLEPRWAVASIALQPVFGDGGNIFNVADDDGRYRYELRTEGPAAPSELSARLDASQVVLRWQDNTPNETGFDIQRRTVGERWSTIGTTQPDMTEYRDTLASTGMYEYRVIALRADINSGPSNIASVSSTPAEQWYESSGGGSGGHLGAGGLFLASLLLLRRRVRV